MIKTFRSSLRNIAGKISRFNRDRKWKHFNHNIEFDSTTRLLDVGFNETEKHETTENYLEKHYPHTQNITALGMFTNGEFQKRYPRVTVVTYDGKDFPFEDQRFNVGWSNAVLEHVGSYEDQIHFLKEMHRTCGTCFLTTPNKFFPIEVHTLTPVLHYLPKRIFHWYLNKTGRSWATGSYMNLLSIFSLKKALKKAGITEYKIIKNRLLFFVLDFVVIF